MTGKDFLLKAKFSAKIKQVRLQIIFLLISLSSFCFSGRGEQWEVFGEVVGLSEDNSYVIFRAYQKTQVPRSGALVYGRLISEEGEKNIAVLKISEERKRNVFVAEVVSGTPEKGMFLLSYLPKRENR